MRGCTPTTLLNSRVIEQNLTTFIYSVNRSLPLKLLKSEWRYSKLYPNAMVMNEGAYVDFVNFGNKSGCHGNIP